MALSPEERRARVVAARERAQARAADSGGGSSLSADERQARLAAARERAGSSGDTPERKGFWGQVGEMANPVTLGKGVWGLAGQAGQTALAPLRAQYRMARYALGDDTALGLEQADHDESGDTSIWEAVAHELPLLTDTAESIDRTLTRLPQYAPMGVAAVADWVGADGVAEQMREHGGEYARTPSLLNPLGLYYQARRPFIDDDLEEADAQRTLDEVRYNPVGSVIEDIGNVALVAGGAGKALGAPAAAANANRAASLSARASGLIDDAARKAADDIAFAEGAVKAGDNAAAQTARARARARTAAAAEEAAKLNDEAARLTADYEAWAASPRGQFGQAAARVSGLARKYDPYEASFRGIALGGRRAAQAVADRAGDTAVGRAASRVAGGAARTADNIAELDHAAQQARDIARHRSRALDSEQAWAKNIMQDPRLRRAFRDDDATAVATLLDSDVVRDYQSPAWRRFADESPDLAAQEIRQRFGAGFGVVDDQLFTLDDVRRAVDFLDGNLDEGWARRINDARDVHAELAKVSEARWVAGENSPALDKLDPYQRARRLDERRAEVENPTQGPVASKVAHATRKEAQQARKASRVAERAEAAADRLEGRVPDGLETRRDIIAAARNAPEKARLAAEAIVETDPRLAAAIVKSGEPTVARVARALEKGMNQAAKGKRSANDAVASVVDDLGAAPAGGARMPDGPLGDRYARELDAAQARNAQQVASGATAVQDKASRAAVARQRATAARKAADRAQRRLEEAVAKAEASPDTASARYQPRLRGRARSIDHLRRQVKELPENSRERILMEEFLADQLEKTADVFDTTPQFFKGGMVAGGDAPGGGGAGRFGRRGLAEDRARTAGTLPRTARQHADLNLAEARKRANNATMSHFEQRHGMPASQLAEQLGVENPRGRAFEQAADEAGYVAVTRGTMQRVNPADIGADTMFIPKALKDALEKQFKMDRPGNLEKAARILVDKPTTLWKKMVLPLSVRWHVGNVVGNMMLLNVSGQTSWADIIRLAPEARKLRRAVKDGVVDDPVLRDLIEDGIARDLIRESRGRDVLRNRRTAFSVRGSESRTLIEWSWAMNQAVDEMGRMISYLDSVKNKGWDTPKAVRHAQRVLGEFDRLTPWEKQVWRRAFPFYAWMRTITGNVMRLPVEQPQRTAWILSLADRYADDDYDLPSYYAGAYYDPVRGLLFPTSSWIPGSQETVDPADILGGVNPFVKSAYTFGTGQRLDGAFPVQLPPYVSDSEERFNWGVLREDLANMTPYTRIANNPTGEARYSDGTARMRGGRTRYKDRWEDGPLAGLPQGAEEVVRVLGVPYPRPFDADEWARGEERRARERDRQRRRFDR